MSILMTFSSLLDTRPAAGPGAGETLLLVGTEGTVPVAIGVLLGSLASAVTVIPYGVARTGGSLPDRTIGFYLAIAGLAVVLTLGSHLGAAAKAMRTPAIQAGTRG
ncbi:hypothetical protein [Amycolatopsis sp. BJA-103]|uniref:hypothetical protein n=1 Tax=Amycolatopsis sp. BJA-103 TaxID=1911175 RepID=UPI000CA2E1F9|nr:hypothetical protein [Amycolatopsis sp. BJA-103]AUI58832.1 hypothetical protein BKN51_11840 [Amycolatopsis sp. BJA-103]PNE17717.1 hypothetical protein B1H26_22725 [Amycolatopsis sp. BJA-103]